LGPSGAPLGLRFCLRDHRRRPAIRIIRIRLSSCCACVCAGAALVTPAERHSIRFGSLPARRAGPECSARMRPTHPVVVRRPQARRAALARLSCGGPATQVAGGWPAADSPACWLCEQTEAAALRQAPRRQREGEPRDALGLEPRGRDAISVCSPFALVCNIRGDTRRPLKGNIDCSPRARRRAGRPAAVLVSRPNGNMSPR
jgi:hypothetical protein